jgi:hydrogenase-4 transcriptional activator
VSESTDILRFYLRLVRQMSGAASVSLYVPAGPAGEREILVHDGRQEPLPELAEPESAAELHRALGPGALSDEGSGPVAGLPSRDSAGILYAVSLSSLSLRGDEEPASPDRRRREGRLNESLVAWIGLRRPPEAALPRGAEPGMGDAILAVREEGWWRSFLGLAAAFAAQSRATTLLDPVTGLPDRAEFQARLEGGLAHTARSGRSLVLLLVGPDDFGWVNERLDRRSGDRVLREIAAALRGGLRTHDHVARYGGAIFTVVLVDTSLEEGLVVAENVVRRLGDQRYHGGILRLEFSAGVAVAPPAAPGEAQELVRRADQALSAAKRGGAGCVRLWEKGSDVERAGSLDRLQGIFTGDKSKDYRNMRLLLDSVAVVAASTDAVELSRRFTERLFEALRAQRVGVLERGKQETFTLLGGLERSEEGPREFRVAEPDLLLLEEACRRRQFVAQDGEREEDPSRWALPLLLEDRCLGGIVLEAASLDVSFEGSDRKFLDALAAAMAVALDRAGLAERERARQREENERLEAELADLRRVARGSRLAYRSPAMESLLATARKVARTDTTVLITGESGTGKEMMAHMVHGLSPRHERPLVVVDCGAIAPTLIESELFGHERGAFTGAHARKPGRLAQAEGATVFLDEIGELPLDLQTKLLRFVQEKQFTPVGGIAPRTVDVRIIAATNVDLRARVAQGKFREDLFHRLNVVGLHVPPLRERPDDVVHLAGVFLKQFAALYRRPAHHFTKAAEEALLAYAWPGNVRELQNLILNSVLFCDAPEVDVDDLQGFQSPALRGAAATAAATAAARAQEAPLAERPLARPRAAEGPEGAAKLRRALAAAIASALASGRAAPPPLGKWLDEELLLAAERLSGGVSRRGADLLGIPETTYRRQLQGAGRRRAAGLAVRPPWWPPVADVAEEGRGGGVRPHRPRRRGRLHARRGLPARRDRRRGAGRPPHRGRAPRGDRVDALPPEGTTPAPLLKTGAPKLRWRLGAPLSAPPGDARHPS